MDRAKVKFDMFTNREYLFTPINANKTYMTAFHLKQNKYSIQLNTPIRCYTNGLVKHIIIIYHAVVKQNINIYDYN